LITSGSQEREPEKAPLEQMRVAAGRIRKTTSRYGHRTT
jgi:hypothetical protein